MGPNRLFNHHPRWRGHHAPNGRGRGPADGFGDAETGTFVEDPEGEAYYEIKTWWRSMDDFVAWTRREAFAEAHKNRAPKEMFAGPNKLVVHELFLSTDPEP